MDAPEESEKIYVPLSELGGLPPRRPPPAPSRELTPSTSQPKFTPVSIPSLQPQGTPFACPQCRTALFGGSLPGLCPVCKHWITETPNTLQPFAPAPAPAPAPAYTSEPESADAAVPDPTLISRRPMAHWINRTGNFNFRALGPEDVSSREPDYESVVAKPTPGNVTQPAADPNPRGMFAGRLVRTVTLVTILVFATIFGVGWYFLPDRPIPQVPPPQALKPLRDALDEAAQETLKAVLSTRDPAVIAKQVIGGQELHQEIQRRIDSKPEFPRFSEADIVYSAALSEADLRRGLAGLIYQAPPDATLSLDSPLLAAEMSSGIKAYGLLERAAVIEYSSKPAPRQALAFFTKRDGKMLLDWHLFVQTWDRTLRSFNDGDLGPGPLRFRVILSLDKPVYENGELADETIIRVQDPLHKEDVIRLVISYYDPVVTALFPETRDSEADPSASTRSRTATVEMIRSPESGRVTIARLVCKEFLGLGGQENDPAAE